MKISKFKWNLKEKLGFSPGVWEESTFNLKLKGDRALINRITDDILEVIEKNINDSERNKKC